MLDDHGRFSRRPRNRRPIVVFDSVKDCHGEPQTMGRSSDGPDGGDIQPIQADLANVDASEASSVYRRRTSPVAEM